MYRYRKLFFSFRKIETYNGYNNSYWKVGIFCNFNWLHFLRQNCKWRNFIISLNHSGYAVCSCSVFVCLVYLIKKWSKWKFVDFIVQWEKGLYIMENGRSDDNIGIIDAFDSLQIDYYTTLDSPNKCLIWFRIPTLYRELYTKPGKAFGFWNKINALATSVEAAARTPSLYNRFGQNEIRSSKIINYSI